MPSANSPKTRDYLITANQGAESYDDFLERIENLNYVLYAMIVHDKDVILEVDPNTGETHEVPKKVHKHAVIELRNAVSFNSIQKKFPGAHIDTIHYKKSAYQYLIHNRPNARDKYQYDANEIISNSLDAVKETIKSETFELFQENAFMKYIAQGTLTSYQFTKRFGLNVYRQYWKPYSDMLDCLKFDEEAQADLERIKKALDDELPF